jgi:putative membrane protein
VDWNNTQVPRFFDVSLACEARRQSYQWIRGEVMNRIPIRTIGIAAAFVLAASAAHAQSPDRASQKFIKSAIQGNYAEVDVGNLAQEKGASDAVKQYGGMLVKDHSEANEKAKQVATQLGVTPPTGASVTQKAKYLKLKVLSGATFDRTFVSDMVRDHQTDINAYQNQARKTDPAGMLAKETLPTLRHHLEVAQQLQRQWQQQSTMR